MLNKVDADRNHKREISLLQLHEQEDLLIKNDVEAMPEKQEPPLLNMTKDIQPDKKYCNINWTLVFMYTFLTVVSVSLIYFNLQIYKTNISHSTFINTSLNSTKIAISEREAGINADINRYVQSYSQKIEKFNIKLQDLQNKLEDIKKDSQYTLDKIQLLSMKNVEDLELINNIQKEQKKFVSDIKEFHNEVEIKNQYKFFVYNNQHQDMTRIESIVWVFTQNYEKDGEYLRQLYLNNIKTYAYKSSFEIKFVTKTNYPYFLSSVLLTKISSIFKILERRLGGHDRTNLGDHFDTIKKVLIMVAILYEHGGVILIDNIAITQPLYWLQDPSVLKSFSHFDPDMPPQVVSFYNYYYSDQKVASTSQFKQIYAFPNIQRYFLASIKKSEFVNKLIDEMIYILNSPATIKNEISEKYQMGILKGDDPYYEFFYIAGHLVIQKKQKQLDLVSRQDKKLYATDYYGLYTINSMIGPTKLSLYFKSQTQAYVNINLMDIKRSEFNQKAGPVRFIHFFENYQQANQQMLDIRNGRRKILGQSFIHQLFYSSEVNNLRYLYERPELTFPISKPWANLPKKVWIYLSEHSNNQISKLIIQNNFKMSKQSGFQVLTVNSKTIEFYLSKDIMNDVIDKFRKSRYAKSQTLRDYTLMLCLLANQGGVFVDQSYLFLEGLNWLQNINQVKPQFMINKMGETPKMFLFHSNHQRYQFNYTFDPKMHSRADNHVLYQKSFIAVENDSLIIDQLVDQILKAIYMTNEQLDRKFLECGIRDEAQYKRNPDLLPMDLLKCIYINGIKEATSQDYVKETNPYNIWSLDGDFSIYKLRDNSNYQNVQHHGNKLLTNFAMYETEQRIGPIFKMLKLDQANLNFLNAIYSSKGDQPYKIVHKQSIFSKYFLIKN